MLRFIEFCIPSRSAVHDYYFVLQAGTDQIEEHINNNARDTDVKPDGKGPPGDGTMRWKATLHSTSQRDDGQHGNGGGKERVGGKDAEINDSDSTRLVEANRSDVVVIDKIADQKHTRDTEGCP